MRIAEGVHRVGNDIVAFYLLATDEGVTVIDAGVSGQWRDFVREIGLMQRGIDDVKAVVLTHGDEDHVGIAERLRHDHGVPVHVHRADAGRARGEGKPPATWGAWRLGPLLRFLGFMALRGGLRTRWVREVHEFGDGERLSVPGGLRVVPLPGHSPGSVALLAEQARAVFVGDALTTRHVLTGEVGVAPAPFTDDPEDAMRSMESLRDLDVDWVLPGHGAPQRGPAADVVDAYLARAAAQ